MDAIPAGTVNATPLWVVVVQWNHDRSLSVLLPLDALLPVYDLGSAGVIAHATVEDAVARRMSDPLDGRFAAYFFNQKPDLDVLSARASGYEDDELIGLAGLMIYDGGVLWERPQELTASP